VLFQETGRTVYLSLDYGNNIIINQTIVTNNYSVLGVLEFVVGHKNLDMTYYQGMGYLIDGINGVENGATVTGIDDTGNYYWQYYVNDDLPFVAAERYILENGDNLLWVFEEMVW
jgi:hypothetical protein